MVQDAQKVMAEARAVANAHREKHLAADNKQDPTDDMIHVGDSEHHHYQGGSGTPWWLVLIIVIAALLGGAGIAFGIMSMLRPAPAQAATASHETDVEKIKLKVRWRVDENGQWQTVEPASPDK